MTTFYSFFNHVLFIYMQNIVFSRMKSMKITRNFENIHDVNCEDDCIDLIKLKEEHAKIIAEWDERVEVLTK